MKEQEKIASEIYNKYGLDFKTATRAGGWTNAVWLNGDLALRLSFKKDSDRIRRELRLSEHLPTEIGYPVNIEVGITDGYEWSLSKRIYGNNLSDIWSNLNWQERVSTIRQIIEIIQLLHTVDIGKIESSRKAWYSSFDAHETYSYIENYIHKKIISIEQAGNLYEILERFWKKHNTVNPVLNHGDITMDNLLYSNSKIVSLMDFEHYVIAPSELDLHSIINLAFFSGKNDFTIDCNVQESRQYKKDIIELLKPMLSNPDSADLILGYAVLYRQRFLEFWLENPKGEIEKLDAYNKFISLADGYGGYLSEIIFMD